MYFHYQTTLRNLEEIHFYISNKNRGQQIGMLCSFRHFLSFSISQLRKRKFQTDQGELHVIIRKHLRWIHSCSSNPEIEVPQYRTNPTDSQFLPPFLKWFWKKSTFLNDVNLSNIQYWDRQLRVYCDYPILVTLLS